MVKSAFLNRVGGGFVGVYPIQTKSDPQTLLWWNDRKRRSDACREPVSEDAA